MIWLGMKPRDLTESCQQMCVLYIHKKSTKGKLQKYHPHSEDAHSYYH